MRDGNNITAFINGPVTNYDTFYDEMNHDPSFHHEDGLYQAILGVNTDPLYQNQGYASKIMKQVISDAKKQGRKGCILICKKELIAYYQKFGFKNYGISKSSLANQTWYDLKLLF